MNTYFLTVKPIKYRKPRLIFSFRFPLRLRWQLIFRFFHY
nr:MAG TPA: hypothetical protein [Caudoviricetes sp.]